MYLYKGETNDTEQNLAEDSDLPECWSMTVYNNNLIKRPWLLVKGGKLGCSYCLAAVSVSSLQRCGPVKNISHQWVNTKIGVSGTSSQVQQGSLRKKLSEHEHSAAHKSAEAIYVSQNNASNNSLKRKSEENHSDHIETTSRCFRTVYKVAKHSQQYVDYKADITVQQLNGIDIGQTLHSLESFTKITSHIASGMKNELLRYCTCSDSKFSVLLDEITYLGKKPCIMVYLRCGLPGCEKPSTFFISLIELDSSRAQSIKDALLKSLSKFGFSEEYCQANWLGIATNGCSTLIGKRSSLIALLQKQFPKLLAWYCAAHRLELAVGEALNSDPKGNSFTAFVEILHSVCSMSPRNRQELREVVESLDLELMKVGLIFNVHWVSSSVRTVKAVWQNLPALFEYFTKAAKDSTRSNLEQVSFSVLAKQLSNKAFVTNLGFMFDILKELSSVAQQLQTITTNMMTAHSRLLLTRQLFVSLKERRGRYESEAEGGSFKGVPLSENVTGVGEINRNQFLEHLISTMDGCTFTNAGNFYDTVISNMKVLDKSNWLPEQLAHPGFADEKIVQLCKMFRVDEESVRRSFRDYVFSGGSQSMLGSVSQLLQAISLIPVQTVECERGLSSLNSILTPQMASASTQKLDQALFLYTTGPPLEMFNPEPYVKSWLQISGQVAKDAKLASKKRKDFTEHPLFKFWNSQ